MQQTEIDGVPALWRPAHGALTGTLMFRVGRCDEDFVGGGVTHLIEHLVMSALGRSHLDANATVSIGHTAFTATGEPDEVSAFLSRVAAVLDDLPTERLEIEASVVGTEGGSVMHALAGALLAARYGVRDLGLAGFDEPAVAQISVEHVRGWGRRFFVRQNAVAWFTGPVPAGIALKLPDGERNMRRRGSGPLTIDLPAVDEHPMDSGIGMSFVARESPALRVAARVLERRIWDDLRHTRGMAYEVHVDGVRIGDSQAHVVALLDSRPKDVAAAGAALLEHLRAVSADGPTNDELAFDLEGHRRTLADPEAVPAMLESAALDLLAGEELVMPESELDLREHVKPSEVASAVGGAEETVIMLAPEGADVGELPLKRRPPSLTTALTGRRHRRRLTGDAPRGAHLVLADDGITIRLPDRTETVRFDDVVGVGRTPDGWYRVLGVDGTHPPIDAKDWRGGEAVVRRLLEAVPPNLVFDIDEESSEPA